MLKLNSENIITNIFVIITYVLIWRGAWGLMDLFLYPRNQFISYSISLIIGISILIIINKNFIKNINTEK